jgi:hypothetical protein
MSGMRDTSSAARREQIEAIRRLSPSERLRTAFTMSEQARQLSLAGIRRRHPEWTDEQVKRELRRLMLGSELAAQVERWSSGS